MYEDNLEETQEQFHKHQFSPEREDYEKETRWHRLDSFGHLNKLSFVHLKHQIQCRGLMKARNFLFTAQASFSDLPNYYYSALFYMNIR